MIGGSDNQRNGIVWIVSLTLAMTFQSAKAEEMPAACRYLPAYEKPAGVDYVPGVDVHGKPVVSADLNAAPFEVPDVIEVPLTVDIVERARDLPDQYPGLEGLSNLGVIEIHKDGLVTYNGQDWTGGFYALCGQKAPDAVLSSDTDEKPPVETDEERVLFGGGYND